MRKIYLIRHARPLLPPGKRICYGITDLPLSPLGHMQGVLVGEYMKDKPITAMFCSNLSRSRQTAEYVDPDPIGIEGFREMDAGDWEGLSFDEIRERWPEEYTRRAEDNSLTIPGGEPAEDAHVRFRAALDQAVARTEGDIAIVTHGTVMQLFLCDLTGMPPSRMWKQMLPWGSVTEIGYDGEYHLLDMGRLPHPVLTRPLCERLMRAAGGPLDHCRQVAKTAGAIAGELPGLDAALLRSAALLHDAARSQPDHPKVGASWLREMGYPEVAEVVEAHHDPDSEDINEKTVLFLADKMPIEERFAASLKKCTTPEAIAAHRRRYALALTLKNKINAACGKEVIV